MIVCDLQGVIEDDIVVLADPVIISKSGSYGPTDLGAKGIETFFFRPHAKFFAASLLQRTSRGPAELISAVACSIGPNRSQAPPVWQTTMIACKQISDACRSNAEWAQMWTRGSTCNGQRKAILRFEATEAAGSVSADHLRCGARVKWGRCGVCLVV